MNIQKQVSPINTTYSLNMPNIAILDEGNIQSLNFKTTKQTSNRKSPLEARPQHLKQDMKLRASYLMKFITKVQVNKLELPPDPYIR